MVDRDIYIHAGAHRTGSSSFQMCLHVNRASLSAAGYDLSYPGRDGVPSGDLSLRLPAPRHDENASVKFAKRISQQFANSSRPLILSEENIPGRMFHFSQGQFYPAASKRFEALRRGFQSARLCKLIFIVRRYDELFLSWYRKRAEDNVVDPFQGLRDQLANFAVGWPELIDDMQRILKADRILVVPYEKRGHSIDILTHLLPEGHRLELHEPNESLNVSATDAALIALQSVYLSGRKLSRPDWKHIIQEHSANTKSLGFANFLPAQRSHLAQRYRQDLNRIAQIPGVELLA